MGRLADKVAFITGAARGQGRSYAVRLAEEGADIIAVDIAAQIDSVPYDMATAEDLAETVKLVESLDRRIVATQADVRDLDEISAALADGVAQLGKLDIVNANAGIWSFGSTEDLDPVQWKDMLDVNLTGAWNTAKAALPHLKSNPDGGSITLTSSVGGLKGLGSLGHYVSAKHGLVGLMRTLALELAPDNIRVNSIHPTSVLTDMLTNPFMYGVFAPDMAPETRTLQTLSPRFTGMHALPIPYVESIDVSNALLFLASDEARYITGVALPVDGGLLVK